MQTRASIAKGIDFDYSAHLAAVFGGDTGSVDGKGIDVISFDFRTEAGRPIVGEGDAVDHELSLILRAARMENSVAFEKPSWLGVDEVRKRTAGERGGTVGYRFRVDVVDGSGAFGIEKSGAGGDIHVCAESGDVEHDDVLGGECGMDLDNAVVGGERFTANLETVTTERKIASGKFSGVVGEKERGEVHE